MTFKIIQHLRVEPLSPLIVGGNDQILRESHSVSVDDMSILDGRGACVCVHADPEEIKDSFELLFS